VWNRTYIGQGSARANDLLIHENVLYVVGSTNVPMGGSLPDLVLLKYDLDDVREFYNNNLGWLRSAKSSPCSVTRNNSLNIILIHSHASYAIL